MFICSIIVHNTECLTAVAIGYSSPFMYVTTLHALSIVPFPTPYPCHVFELKWLVIFPSAHQISHVSVMVSDLIIGMNGTKIIYSFARAGGLWHSEIFENRELKKVEQSHREKFSRHCAVSRLYS